MNVFDIIGPVMIGPSSSHTAGAVRLGRVANKLMDSRTPSQVEITLSGSFAQTYRGHGTDRALLAGIMGFHSYSEEIRDALRIAGERIHKSLQESAVRTAGNLLEQGVPLWVVRKSVLHLPEHFLLELQKQKMN